MAEIISYIKEYDSEYLAYSDEIGSMWTKSHTFSSKYCPFSEKYLLRNTQTHPSSLHLISNHSLG